MKAYASRAMLRDSYGQGHQLLMFGADGALGHGAACQLSEGLHGIRLGFSQGCKALVDILDQAGMVKSAHGVLSFVTVCAMVG